MSGKSGKSGNGSGNKKLYYCYYWNGKVWLLYQPKLDDAGKPALKDLFLHEVGVKHLKRPDALLFVSAEKNKEVPSKLLGVELQASRAVLEKKGLQLHKLEKIC